MVGNKKLKRKFNEFIDEQSINQLLFAGPPGTGKTTAAKILMNKIAPNNNLYINASDENSVETIRNKVKNFASSISFAGQKIIFLDESDYISLNGQAALRRVMEDFSENTRFILTANYHEKIIPALKSRCQMFIMKPMNMKQIIKYVVKILKNENVHFEPEDVLEVVKNYKPDVRKIINVLQQNVNTDNTLDIGKTNLVKESYKTEILQAFSNDNPFKKIRQIIADNNINQFSELYSYLFDNVEKIIDEPMEYYILIAEYMYRDSIVVDKEINFMGLIAEMLTK